LPVNEIFIRIKCRKGSKEDRFEDVGLVGPTVDPVELCVLKGRLGVMPSMSVSLAFWEDNIKVDLKLIVSEGVEWIDLDQDHGNELSG
jgi:hypothetical protein